MGRYNLQVRRPFFTAQWCYRQPARLHSPQTSQASIASPAMVCAVSLNPAGSLLHHIWRLWRLLLCSSTTSTSNITLRHPRYSFRQPSLVHPPRPSLIPHHDMLTLTARRPYLAAHMTRQSRLNMSANLYVLSLEAPACSWCRELSWIVLTVGWMDFWCAGRGTDGMR